MGLRDLIFPAICPVCERVLWRGERHICLECLTDAPLSYYWNWRDNPAEQLVQQTIPVERVASLLLYRSESSWKRVIHRFKYDGNKDIGKYLSLKLGERLKESRWDCEIDLIIPVPLHFFKYWKRGFNQSEYISGILSSVLEVPTNTSILKRKRYTSSQTKKDREERSRSVKGAFVIKKHGVELISGKSVLLVDDVLTTGATISECGEVLIAAGCSKISVATLAFVE